MLGPLIGADVVRANRARTIVLFSLVLPLAAVVMTMMASSAIAGNRPPVYYDPGARPVTPAPIPPRRVPSPDSSSAGSPIRDYIYRAPADSGSIRNRLAPPSITRPGPRGY